MELYGPRAAQYQYHGRAEVTRRSRSTSTLTPSCGSNDGSKEGAKQGEQETPMEEIVLGERQEKRFVEHDTNFQHDANYVKDGSSDRKMCAALGSQSGGEHGLSKEEDVTLDEDVEGGISIGLSAGDTARAYLRQLLEGGDKKVDIENATTATMTQQPAAEPSGQSSRESSDGGTSDQSSLPLTADVRSSAVTGHEEDTDEKYEIKSFQRLFDPGSSASAVGQNFLRLTGFTSSTLPSSMLFSSNSSISVASVHSASSVMSSSSQSPSQRTRNLKNKRRVIRNTKSSSQPSAAVNLDQIMPTKVRGRSPQGSRAGSACSVSSSRTFHSTDLNLCPISEDGSHGECAEEEGDPVEVHYVEKIRRRSSGPLSVHEEDVHPLPPNIVTTREKNRSREVERSPSRNSNASRNSRSAFKGHDPQRSIPEGHDVVPNSITWNLKEEDRWRIDTEDFMEGSKEIRPNVSRSNSRRHFLGFNKVTSSGTLKTRTSESLHRDRPAEGIRLVEGSDEESRGDRYVSVVDFNGIDNNVRGKSRKTKMIQFVTEPSVAAKRACCILFFVSALVLVIFFVVSTSLHKIRAVKMEGDGDDSDASHYDALNNLNSDLAGQDHIGTVVGDSETTVISSSIVLETIMTTLEPFVGTDLFMIDDNSPQFSALSWVLNDDPLAIGKALAAAQKNNTQNLLVHDLKTRLLQRFALASFYHGSSPDEWTNSSLWLSEAHECEWFGIECESYSSPAIASTSDHSVSHRRYLGASTNQLNNTIIGMNLSENNIVTSTGIVPDLKALNHLQSLVLSNNKISGELGEWIGELKSLQVIRLEGNRLQGQIPKSLASLKSLVELRLENNSFNDSNIPRNMCHLDNLSILTADCESSAIVRCECCTECFGKEIAP